MPVPNMDNRELSPFSWSSTSTSSSFSTTSNSESDLFKLYKDIIKSTSLMKRLPFQRLVRQIMEECELEGYRFEVTSLFLLQKACENYITLLFENANLNAFYDQRRELMPQDIKIGYEKMKRLQKN